MRPVEVDPSLEQLHQQVIFDLLNKPQRNEPPPILNHPYIYLMDRACQSDFYEDQSATD